MEINLVTPKIMPKITGVMSIDPAAHSGLSTGSIVNDLRWIQSLSFHDDPKRILLQTQRFKHPLIRIRGDKTSGTGVFFVTEHGRFGWTTLQGFTSEIIYDLFQITEEYLGTTPFFILEKPHPDNVSVMFSFAYIAGALCFAYETEPIIIHPRKYPNQRKIYEAFSRKFGFKYEPTPHELDATIRFIETFYLSETEISEHTSEEAVPDLKEPETVVMKPHMKLRSPETMNAYFNGKAFKTGEEHLERIITEMQMGTLSPRKMVSIAERIAKNVEGIKKFGVT